MQDESFWQTETQPVFPILRGRRNADAVVVGGGLSGLHIAFWLCKAGLRVVLLEARTLGCGASGRCGGLVTQSHHRLFTRLETLFPSEVCRAYTQTQQAALQSLRELASEPEMDSGWKDMDAFLVAATQRERPLLQAEHEAMTRAGFSAKLQAPTSCPIPAAMTVQFHGQACLQPDTYLLSLVQKAARIGLLIFENSRVISMESNLVYTPRGSVLAPYIIIATGYPVINTPGWYFMRMYQKSSYLIPIEDDATYDGVYLDMNDRFSLRRHREGTLFHLIDGRVGTRTRENPLHLFASQYADAFEHALPARVYGGFDSYTADGLPYIGTYGKRTPNIFVATGYGHHGILHSVVAAQAISAKILGLPEEGYSIYSGQRGGRVVWQMEAKTTAAWASRYLQGTLRPHAPRCSHMGCKLVYRTGNKSWECPCHGSRFDDIGRVLGAPAVDDTPIRHKRKG